MARNIDPVCKMCRREQMKLYLKGERCFSPKCPIDREKPPPGMHGIQGLGAGFVPEILERAAIDNVIEVSDVAAERMARRLAREEGLLVGPSSGANVHAALEVANQIGSGMRSSVSSHA